VRPVLRVLDVTEGVQLGGLPRFCMREVEGFLRCGILGYGHRPAASLPGALRTAFVEFCAASGNSSSGSTNGTGTEARIRRMREPGARGANKLATPCRQDRGIVRWPHAR